MVKGGIMITIHKASVITVVVGLMILGLIAGVIFGSTINAVKDLERSNEYMTRQIGDMTGQIAVLEWALDDCEKKLLKDEGE